MRSTAGANLRTFELPVVGRQLTAAVWWTAVVLLSAVSGLLLVRRLAGAFVEPLGSWQLIGTTAVVVLVTGLIQFRAPGGWVAMVAPSVSAAIGLTALTLPGTAPWSVALSWFGLVIAQAALLIHWSRPQLRRRPAPRAPAMKESETEQVSDSLVQQLTRDRNAGGGESLHALVRVTWPAGDSLTVVHLAFCPPLDRAPRLTAHALDDSGADAKVTLAETYGARIEVRRPHSQSEVTVALIEVVGQSPPG
jgi:hypothetical protein